MKVKVFIAVICVQIGVIILIFLQIQNKKNNISGVSINPVDSSSIQKSSTEQLNYFYEPKANFIRIVKEDWMQREVKNTINNDTLNERFEYSEAKKGGTFRIIALGDSFTYGENVSTENNWTELLEVLLNKKIKCKNISKYEVINLGVMGYDTQYEVERYAKRGVKYNADLVLWLFTDYERILEQMMPLIKQNDTLKNKELEKNGTFFDNWRIAREAMLKEVGNQGIIKYQTDQIKQMDNYYGGKILFMSFPDKKQYIDILKGRTANRPNSFFFQPNINFNNGQLFLPDHHFNEEGNKAMMQEVADYIFENRLTNCQ